MRKRTGGIWQEIELVSDELDDLKTDFYGSIDKLETHLRAMDKRITDYFEANPVESKSVAKRKTVQKKSKS